MEPMLAKCDDRGRIYLEKEIREEYGKTFILIRAPDELILLPIPKHPLKHFQELGKKLPKLSLQSLKKEIRKQALMGTA